VIRRAVRIGEADWLESDLFVELVRPPKVSRSLWDAVFLYASCPRAKWIDVEKGSSFA
jgi:hypothetical protein